MKPEPHGSGLGGVQPVDLSQELAVGHEEHLVEFLRHVDRGAVAVLERAGELREAFPELLFREEMGIGFELATHSSGALRPRDVPQEAVGSVGKRVHRQGVFPGEQTSNGGIHLPLGRAQRCRRDGWPQFGHHESQLTPLRRQRAGGEGSGISSWRRQGQSLKRMAVRSIFASRASRSASRDGGAGVADVSTARDAWPLSRHARSRSDHRRAPKPQHDADVERSPRTPNYSKS